jgi:DNA-binding NtrC family response regulator
MESPKTILVVDDSDAIVQLARTVLFLDGYTVLCGCNGEDALHVNAHHDSPIHMLLTDVRMGALNGCDLADAMRRARPGIKVLYMSAYTDDERVARDVEAGRAGFMPKPFSPSELLARVGTALYGAVPARPRG